MIEAQVSTGTTDDQFSREFNPPQSSPAAGEGWICQDCG